MFINKLTLFVKETSQPLSFQHCPLACSLRRVHKPKEEKPWKQNVIDPVCFLLDWHSSWAFVDLDECSMGSRTTSWPPSHFYPLPTQSPSTSPCFQLMGLVGLMLYQAGASKFAQTEGRCLKQPCIWRRLPRKTSLTEAGIEGMVFFVRFHSLIKSVSFF